MKRILFVDDEPNVLHGLERMLRRLRQEWHMVYAEGGSKALNYLADSPFDVVMTDMRMPGMDGAELLDEVMNLYPATVRIILSGQCDRQSVLKCVRPAHQFLTKPCPSEVIKSTVAQACDSCDRMVDDRQKSLLSRITSLSSDPSVYADLVAELESPHASIRVIAEIVSQDIGMSAKALQLVSSSFFGSPRRVAHPTAAVELLGLDTIKSLTFSSDAFKPFDRNEVEGPWRKRLLCHSLTVARAARAIAETESSDREVAGDAWLAGFLHEVGSLALAQSPHDRPLPQFLDEAETAIAAESNAKAGAYLLALWGLPAPIVTAVALQHSPGHAADQSFTPLTALHAAHALLQGETTASIPAFSAIDMDYLRRIGCANRLEPWFTKCQLVVPQGAVL